MYQITSIIRQHRDYTHTYIDTRYTLALAVWKQQITGVAVKLFCALTDNFYKLGLFSAAKIKTCAKPKT